VKGKGNKKEESKSKARKAERNFVEEKERYLSLKSVP
jgi:hypothetical protein